MKLLRKLIFGIIGFVLLIVIALALVFAISYDDSKCSIDINQEYRKIDTIVGDGIYDSLSAIKESDYEVDKNQISIAFTQDELNNYLVQAIRGAVNPKYLDGEDYIMKYENYELQTFEFLFDGDIITLKFRLKAYFYNTSIKLSTKLSLDNKFLKFKLENAKIGFLPMPFDTAKNIMSNFEFKISENSGFDPKTFEFTFSLEDFFKTLTGNDVLNVILDNCDYLLTVADSKLKLSIETDDIFMKPLNIPKASSDGLHELLNEAKIEASSDPELRYSVSLSEENFNYLIMGNLTDAISSYSNSINIGGKDIDFKFDNIAYDIEKEAFISNLLVCGAASPIQINISIVPIKEGDVVTKLSINMGTVKIGNIESQSLHFFDMDDIDISTLGIEDVTINDLIFDKTNRKIEIKGIYHTS